MNPVRRRAAIFDLIVSRGEVSVDALARRYATSAETIRRDLNHLAEKGQIRKVHGGARRLLNEGEGGFDERMVRNTHAKQVVADKVKALVHPRQTLFMDTGSTTLLCAQALVSIRHLTVVTNSVAIADTFSRQTESAESVYLLGGHYRHGNCQTVGPATVQEATQFQAELAIITVGAIDVNGVWDYSHDEALVARAMMSSSDSLMIVADKSKFDCKAAFKVCALSRIDQLVTDRPPAGPLSTALQGAKVNVR